LYPKVINKKQLISSTVMTKIISTFRLNAIDTGIKSTTALFRVLLDWRWNINDEKLIFLHIQFNRSKSKLLIILYALQKASGHDWLGTNSLQLAKLLLVEDHADWKEWLWVRLWIKI
jgi:hypothetical protein